MPSISDTIAHLQRFRRSAPPGGHGSETSTFLAMEAFGRNPGELRALVHIPVNLPRGAPLVVVLHGCTQTASGYDYGSGWSSLADRFGFALLYPEQWQANNPNGCFNWFLPGDTTRGRGEAESVREMVAAAVQRHGLDRSRVFVTGLSAGGAMTSVMLATYPELFAGGAIIAGLPYGTAVGVNEALARMRGHGHDPASLSLQVRRASTHQGPWPFVSVWHGTADVTVDPVNAAMIVDQWRGVHGVGAPKATNRVNGHLHREWRDTAGRAVIEEHAIAGLGHGTPVATTGDEACGVPGAYMLSADISSTYRIAASWGIVPARAPSREASPATGSAKAVPLRVPGAAAPLDPGRVINDALRAAGLMNQ